MNNFISELYKYRFLIHELVVRDILAFCGVF